MRVQRPSTSAADPCSAPERRPSAVFLPSRGVVAASSTWGKKLVPALRAFNPRRSPGAMAPPRKVPSAAMASTVSAVPASSDHGRPAGRGCAMGRCGRGEAVNPNPSRDRRSRCAGPNPTRCSAWRTGPEERVATRLLRTQLPNSATTDPMTAPTGGAASGASRRCRSAAAGGAVGHLW